MATETTLPPPNAFIGATQAPAAGALTAVLGARSRARWDRLVDALLTGLGAKAAAAWYSYSPAKHGWFYRVQSGKRTIVYLNPSGRRFSVAFLFGGKAQEAIRAAGLPARVQTMLAEARRYPEGIVVRIDVASAADIELIRKLAVIKARS